MNTSSEAYDDDHASVCASLSFWEFGSAGHKNRDREERCVLTCFIPLGNRSRRAILLIGVWLERIILNC